MILDQKEEQVSLSLRLSRYPERLIWGQKKKQWGREKNKGTREGK